MRNTFVCRILVGCVLVLLLHSAAWGQAGNQGSVGGTVVDQKGGSVSGAALNLRSTATGASYETTADEDGVFVFAIVPVGTYELIAKKEGFNTVTWKKIEVNVGARVSLTVTLPVATQAATVEVTEEAPLVETARTQVSSTVNSQAVSNLPVLGRNTFYLPRNITLDPRITKNISVNERMKFQLLLEAFNVFNKNNVFAVFTGQYSSVAVASCSPVVAPAPTICLRPSATFGTQTSNFSTPISPRIVQLGAKFIF